VIDLHAHVVLELVLGAAGSHGPELFEVDGEQRFRVGGYTLCGVRYRGSLYMDPSVRLAEMDARGVSMQLLSPNPLTYFHFIDTDDAVAFCRAHNDALAALVAEHPDRFVGAATLPMQDVAAAVDELDRAVRELGLCAAYIGTSFGRPLDDAALDPFYERIAALDVPLFVHPAPSGIDGPQLDERLRRFDLDLQLEFAYEETLAVATLVFGGVLHRHPSLDICVSHGGGAMTVLYPKLRHAARNRAWAPEWLRADGAFEQQLGRLWFDVHVGDDSALDLLVARIGTSHLVHGTNFGGWDSAIAHPFPPDLAETFDANARRLLRIGPARR
jgi:aminocarboxymuconate-semialdehyde decarboxylase